MPALANISADLMALAPQSATSANAGNEGIFASHLKTATDQQATPASAAGAAQKQTRGRHAHDAAPSQGAKKINAAQPTATAEDTPAADVNGETAATTQRPEPAEQADTILSENMLVNPLAIGPQQRESVVTQLLASLAAGITAETGNEPQANITSQSAAQPAQVQLTGELAGAPADAETPISAGQSANPGTQASVPTPAAAISTADQTAQAGKSQGAMAAASVGSQATESADATSSVPATTAGTTSPAPNVQTQAQTGTAMIVQNKYGQVITIHQGKPGEEESEGDVSPPSTPVTEDQKVDVNGNYIRSRLPKNHADNAMEPGKNQAANAPQVAKQQEQSSAAEAVKTAATAERFTPSKAQPVLHQEASPFIAAGQPLNPGQQTSGSTPITSVAMHLPSGMIVPDGTIVDQMITHFSINKQLENSTVNLRLYPEELGELRMEIKVAQDNIKAHIVVQSPQAQEMLDRHLPRLREALEQQGLQLQQVEVSVAAHGQTGGERFQENNAWRQQTHSSSRHAVDQSDFTQELEEIVGDDSAASTLSVLV